MKPSRLPALVNVDRFSWRIVLGVFLILTIVSGSAVLQSPGLLSELLSSPEDLVGFPIFFLLAGFLINGFLIYLRYRMGLEERTRYFKSLPKKRR
ncbi:MAG: hypothetical protein AAF322_07495 [Pseudomonadota bacterium]